jgi:hypothetical protein
MSLAYPKSLLQAALDLVVDKIVHFFWAVVVLIAFLVCEGNAKQVVLFASKFADYTASLISNERQHESDCRGLEHSVRKVVVLVLNWAPNFKLLLEIKIRRFRRVNFPEEYVKWFLMSFFEIYLGCRNQLINQKLQFLDPRCSQFTLFEKSFWVLYFYTLLLFDC